MNVTVSFTSWPPVSAFLPPESIDIVTVPFPDCVGESMLVLVFRVNTTDPFDVVLLLEENVPLSVVAVTFVPSATAFPFLSFAVTVIVACPPTGERVDCDISAPHLPGDGGPENITRPGSVWLMLPQVTVISTRPFQLSLPEASVVNVAVALPFVVVLLLLVPSLPAIIPCVVEKKTAVPSGTGFLEDVYTTAVIVDIFPTVSQPLMFVELAPNRITSASIAIN